MPLEWKHWQGQKINEKFELGEFVGGLADSAVFLTSLGGAQKAAIKLIALDVQRFDAETPDAERLNTEKMYAKKVDRQLSFWASAKNFSHPHIIRIFETGQCLIEEKPWLYVVMEYAEENLSMILPTRALTPTETQEMLDPVLEALAYIHGQGFVHGHLKPSNIMAIAEKVKISCDGITQIGQTDDHPPKQSSYLPPEAATGVLSTSADIWSLGVTLIEVLTQRAPQIRSDAERENVVSKLPSPFRNVASECLWMDPKQRCTITDIQKQLHSPILVSVPANDAPPAPPKRRSLVGPITTVVLLLALLGGMFLFQYRSRQPKPPEGTTQSQVISPASPTDEQKAATDSVAPAARVGSVEPRKPVRRVLPDVSNNALRTIHGTIKVKVKVYVGQDGNVERARLESGGPSRYFASKSLDAAKQWKFDTADSDGRNVLSEWDLEFRFSRTSRQVRERPLPH